ncbi:MAG: adenylyl-sulfate reductase [Marinovum sp.]|jgi:hypothetical protein|nr:adenylyl-sulfate reductase [Marinovum sp.]MBT4872915.1 adenylyl-sulfate reductase [Marinovum sp.]MBT6532984.1 adenylyl-sulfate reductase [Marinovum sp.]
MFTTNHFAELSASIPISIIQAYVLAMIALVAGGTIYDVIHKQSAKYFFNAVKKSEANASRNIAAPEKLSLAIHTVASDILTSSEFCNPNRRIAHLLGMYGFVVYLISTIVMVFAYPDPEMTTPSLWPALWALGALMVCFGGYWFWFFIRVDVSAEGQSPFRVRRADLFILSLLASTTLGLIWAYSQSVGSGFWSIVLLSLYLIATTVLFGGVPWSKFSHMFFKSAAAFQKKTANANGSMNNLPRPADRTDPDDRDRHSMELLKDAPLNMGLGIKRERPNHY